MSNQTSTHRCPACGRSIPEGAPQGLCPNCLLAGVGQTQEIPTLPPHLHGPPPLAEVAAAFPHLEIIELIGLGGMGCVFKARQPKLERFVALKLLPTKFAADPSFRERFSREARVLARLNHPNIVSVYDFGEAGGFFYLLMEFVDGANLRQAMRAGRFTPEQALAIVPKICEALQFAHSEGILHRDVKPENILLDTKGRVKIADFGIAKLVGEPQPVTQLTATGATIGTPQYMAPEQIEHPEAVDHRADIYSLGVVFYEMLTGELPIGRFAPPSQKTPMDPRVDGVVLRALEKEREKRYQSAGEVKTSVEHLTGAQGQPGPIRRPLAVEDDFVLCNPRLPRMARAISVYAMILCPVLWLVGVMVSEQPVHTNLYADFVQKMTDGFVHLGEFVAAVIFVIGGIKLRRLRSAGPRLISTAIWIHIVAVTIALLGNIWIDVLNRKGMEDAEAAIPFGEAIFVILALASMVFEIWSLVWLHRNASRLNEIFAAAAPATQLGKPPKERLARRATLAAVFTIVSLILGMPFLGGAVFMGMVLRLQSPSVSFGPPEFVLMVSNVVLVVALGLAGFLPGWWTLRDIRSAGGQGGGFKRALLATLAWPTLLTLVAVALAVAAGLGGYLPNGRGFIWKMSVTTLLATTIGVVLVLAAWRWGRAIPRGQKAGKAWLVGGVAALLLLPPSLPISLWSGMMTVRSAPGSAPAMAKATLQTYPNQPSAAESDRVFNGLLQVPPRHVLLLNARLWSNGVALPVSNLTAYVVAPRHHTHRDMLSWRILAVGDPANRGAGWNVAVGGGSNPILYPPAQGAERPDWKLAEFPGVVQLAPGETRSVRMLRGADLSPSGESVAWEATLEMQLIKPAMEQESLNEESVVAAGSDWQPRVTVLAGAPRRTVTIEAKVPPRETFVVTGIVLSNGVPVGGKELRAKLWPPSGREPSPFEVRWQINEDSSPDGIPWEIVVEDKTSGTIAARLRLPNLPRLAWSVSPSAANMGKLSVTREARTFEVGRALQTPGGGNAGAADWSVRVQLQSSPVPPTASKRGIEAQFELPANQAATFELVARHNRVITPVPDLAAYQVNGSPETYKGRFVLAEDSDDLDSLTGLPRWTFGIIGPDGRLTSQGLAVPPVPADFNGEISLWKSLTPDSEVIEGFSDPNMDRPDYGLRIRTQTIQPKPGLRHVASGFGTNWQKTAAEHLAVASPESSPWIRFTFTAVDLRQVGGTNWLAVDYVDDVHGACSKAFPWELTLPNAKAEVRTSEFLKEYQGSPAVRHQRIEYKLPDSMKREQLDQLRVNVEKALKGKSIQLGLGEKSLLFGVSTTEGFSIKAWVEVKPPLPVSP
ncbi:MAG TPA: serine/threonine-protein kinase [Verrucomicrobiae bacterium]